jgi:hypothetical protein
LQELDFRHVRYSIVVFQYQGISGNHGSKVSIKKNHGLEKRGQGYSFLKLLALLAILQFQNYTIGYIQTSPY